jgi:aryl-alcohol dehydrogenase-like predicted oxidoreductase
MKERKNRDMMVIATKCVIDPLSWFLDYHETKQACNLSNSKVDSPHLTAATNLARARQSTTLAITEEVST